jgi:hypothetical protein
VNILFHWSIPFHRKYYADGQQFMPPISEVVP